MNVLFASICSSKAPPDRDDAAALTPALNFKNSLLFKLIFLPLKEILLFVILLFKVETKIKFYLIIFFSFYFL